jgi:hypothetical protein
VCRSVRAQKANEVLQKKRKKMISYEKEQCGKEDYRKRFINRHPFLLLVERSSRRLTVTNAVNTTEISTRHFLSSLRRPVRLPDEAYDATNRHTNC